MADSDSAFLWETEVLRESRRSAPRMPVSVDDGEDWVTLREASEATGVPTSTIRKWARHDNIPSFLEPTPSGQLRIVSVSGIQRWADVIGREIEVTQPIVTRHGERTEIDLTTTEEPERGSEPPEGSMLVPLDAWNRMLNQLGNLHEAGQQLAEARERAARAETEAAFLKERLGELREEIRRQREEPIPTQDPTAPSGPPRSSSLLRRVYSGWRRNRRG